MAKYVIKAFGITKDIVGKRETELSVEGETVGTLRSALTSRYPALTDIRSLMIAVNSAYADDSVAIRESDEIALIPPVSGG